MAATGMGAESLAAWLDSFTHLIMRYRRYIHQLSWVVKEAGKVSMKKDMHVILKYLIILLFKALESLLLVSL